MSAPVERAYVISLSIPDNEAYTALTTLARMGLPIAAVDRADVWVASVEPERAAALDAALTTLEAIFNPNKHRLEIRSDARPFPGEVWITAIDEAPAAGLGGRSLPGIVRHTSWRLRDKAGNDVTETVRRRAVEGFLCNPAFQKAIQRTQDDRV